MSKRSMAVSGETDAGSIGEYDDGLDPGIDEYMRAQIAGLIPDFRLLTVQELRELPQPRWLVRGLLQKESLSVLYGPSGEGKSFVALDIAASIAAGMDWQGRKVEQGAVVYVVAEGGRGIVRRIEAWASANGATTDGFFIVPEPVQMREKYHRQALVSTVRNRDLKPALIVFDTFARCFVGGDENDAGEVGEFIEGLQEVQRELDRPTVVVVHHTGKTDLEMERGSSALRAAADTMLLLRKQNECLMLTCNKQKDGDEGEPIYLRLKEIDLGLDQEGEKVRSCAVRPGERGDWSAATVRALPNNDQVALEVLRAHPQGLPVAKWTELVGERLGREISENTFAKVRQRLMAAGLVELVPDAEAKYTYRVTVAANA